MRCLEAFGLHFGRLIVALEQVAFFGGCWLDMGGLGEQAGGIRRGALRGVEDRELLIRIRFAEAEPRAGVELRRRLPSCVGLLIRNRAASRAPGPMAYR